MLEWVEEAGKLRGRGEAFVVATVIAAAGSAPRREGAKMLVTADAIVGTVGGGNLEREIIQTARDMLADDSLPAAQVGAFSLAASLGQCCGGKVAFLVERVAPPPLLAVFGAGHIAQALAVIAPLLPCRTVFYDSRPQWLDKLAASANIRAEEVDDCAAAARELPANARVLVMTHSHALDMEICEVLLARNDIAFVGLVGSENKAKKFKTQLKQRGLQIDKLHCPVGGKANLPGEVAIKMAGEIINALPGANRRDAKTEAAMMRELSAMMAKR